MKQPPLHHASGYSLIEVMVAVIVLSIGLTGLGFLQLSNVKNTINTNNYSLASAAAQDMLERVRSNLGAYESGLYGSISSGQSHGCRQSQDCTAQQMAENDVYEWNQYLAQVLPSGAGIICSDSVSIRDGNPDSPACTGVGNTVVKVFWRESANFSNNADQTVDNEWQRVALILYP